MAVLKWQTVVVLFVSALWSSHVLAQVAPCGDHEEVAPWTWANVGMYADGSTQAPDTASIQLCSAAVGLGTQRDQYHLGTRPFPGDFHVQALLTSVDEGGAAGLIAIGPANDPQAARIAIEARTAGPGLVTVRSSIRRVVGASAEPWTETLTATLPVTLRIRRVDHMMRTELEDSSGLQLLLTTDVTESQLSGLVFAGMFQASLERTVQRRAVFGRLNVSVPHAPPDLDCIEPRALISGGTVTLRGSHLDGIRSATFAGTGATVVSAREDQVVLQLGEPTQSGFVPGDVILRDVSGTRTVAGGAAFTGQPFVRGDANGDGNVTREDWTQICYQVHRNHPLACGATGDVDGDGDVDAADLTYLRRFLRDDGPAPHGPYPDAGYVAGALSCGLPSGPALDAVLNDNGDALRGDVREGDVLVIEGNDLPAHDKATVYFDDVPTRVLADSTTRRMRVRVGVVPAAGSRCPVIWRGSSHRGHTRYGQAFTVDHDDALCPTFSASRLPFAFRSQVRGDSVVLSLPSDTFPLGQNVLVDAAFHLPFLDGVSRGPRGVRREVALPAGGRDAYAEGLQHLADLLQKALQGEADDDCACELQVLPNVVDETLTIAPCGELPPDPPTPTVPGLPTQVRPTRTLVGHLELLSPEPPTFVCDDEVDFATDPLGWSWCQVAQVALPPVDHEVDFFEQYPAFESMTPIQVSLDAAYEPWVLTPELKPASQKNTLVDDQVHVGLNMYGYDNGCDMVMRRDRCTGPVTTSWMPRFRQGGRVVKLFWLPQSRVPNGLDVSDLYSWVPADDGIDNTIEERKYLVGMHVNVAKNEDFATGNAYFHWITAWLPLPNGVISPHYNETCTVGTAQKRPASLQGTAFADWVVCNPDVAGQSACGNPWAVIDECSVPAVQGCVGCHFNAGTVPLLDLDAGWLTLVNAYKGADVAACAAQLDANPNLMPNWGGSPVMSMPDAWDPICPNASLHFDDPWKCHYSAPGCTETPGYP